MGATCPQLATAAPQHLLSVPIIVSATSVAVTYYTSICVQDNAAAWERWVYVFAQLRQLAAMAPHIPIQTPRLRQTAYEMMLHAFLLSRSDHSILLALVKEWPTELYSAANLIEAVSQRCVTKPISAGKLCVLSLAVLMAISLYDWLSYFVAAGV